MTGIRLSILDQSPVSAAGSPARAIRESVDLAAALDGRGFVRYWFAEHHHSGGFAGTAPEILVAAALERTRQLRIGTGGVLLPRYPAAKVAEVFGVLGALHEGRVDLGVGRAGGDSSDYPEKVARLRAAFADRAGTSPELWLLGAGTSSAWLAAEHGVNFAYGHFLNPAFAGEALAHHRQHSAPGDPGLVAGGHGPASDSSAPATNGPGPARLLAVRAVAAESASVAAAHASGFLLWRSWKDLGADLPFPTTEQARNHAWTAAESGRRQANLTSLCYGSAEQVRDRLTSLARALQVDEIMINTPLADPAARLRSYLLLAEAFGLGASEPVAAVASGRTPPLPRRLSPSPA